MTDIKKAIKGLEEVDAYFHRMTEVCYRGDEATFCDLKEKVANVIALLKEHEAIKPKIDAFGHPYCPKCKILVYETWNFCPHCGQAVKWVD